MSGLQSSLTEIVTEIIMSRDPRPWLAVEGFSDEVLLRTRKFTNPVKIVVGHGWEGVRDIIVEHSKDASNAVVIGLIDRDYRDHHGCQLKMNKVVFTDMRDVENMMFNSSSLGRVISEYASIHKIPKTGNGAVDIDAMRKRIYSVAVQLGKLRIHCEGQNYQISFKEIDHKKFICDRTLSIDPASLLLHINGKNSGKRKLVQSDWIAAQGLSWPSYLGQAEFVANGHDVMAIMSVALRRMWGSQGGGVDADFIEGIFRVGYSDDDLERTQMWDELERYTQISA